MINGQISHCLQPARVGKIRSFVGQLPGFSGKKGQLLHHISAAPFF